VTDGLAVDDFVEFYRANLPVCTGIAHRLLRGQYGYEDVAADVLVRCLELWESQLGDLTPSQRTAWVCTATSRRCIDVLRRKARRDADTMPIEAGGYFEPREVEEGSSLFSLLIDQERTSRLRGLVDACLPKVAPTRRQAVECFLKDLGGPECARQLGISHTSYTTALSRGRRDIENLLLAALGVDGWSEPLSESAKDNVGALLGICVDELSEEQWKALLAVIENGELTLTGGRARAVVMGVWARTVRKEQV
jgi:RNA polymerase sigma factor (sigma-70 family)